MTPTHAHISHDNGEWIVLRTGSAQTLPLVRSLRDYGVEVWSPVKTISKRRPRSNERREVTVAILPSYVFARASHLADLMVAANRSVSPHPPFSVFKYCGKVPIISDRSLENLRRIEKRALPEKAARQFKQGERVRITEGGFAGMTGIVKTGRGRYTMVLFPGFSMPIKVKSMLLVDEIDQPERELAA
jgi:transcription antitermination factor NusG